MERLKNYFVIIPSFFKTMQKKTERIAQLPTLRSDFHIGGNRGDDCKSSE